MVRGTPIAYLSISCQGSSLVLCTLPVGAEKSGLTGVDKATVPLHEKTEPVAAGYLPVKRQKSFGSATLRDVGWRGYFLEEGTQWAQERGDRCREDGSS